MGVDGRCMAEYGVDGRCRTLWGSDDSAVFKRPNDPVDPVSPNGLVNHRERDQQPHKGGFPATQGRDKENEAVLKIPRFNMELIRAMNHQTFIA